MKKIFKVYCLLALMSVCISSCKDILTEKPTSFLTPGSFPGNQKDALAAVNAAYSRIFSSTISFYYGCVTTDEAFQGYHNKRPSVYFANLSALDGDATVMWQNSYEGIARANTVIDYVPKINMDLTLRNRIVAEAKFLRAYYYFDLVRIYGGVPVLDKSISGPDAIVGIKRNTVTEVYDLIKKDLNEAIKDLPIVYPAVDAGRVTAGAARSLLVRVYMTMGDWNNANETAKLVIGSSNYGLVKNYNSLWDQNADNQLFPDKNGALVNEVIFARQYQQDLVGSQIGTWTGSRDVEIKGGASAFGGGFENMLLLPGLKSMFEPGDLRLGISYVENLDGNQLVSPNTPGAGPITGKFLNRPGVTKYNNSSQNVPIIRYSDVLLMRAEAENELNGPDGAYQFINLVRERAGIPPLSGLDKNGLRLAIRKERATELSLEGIRKFDLLRWGIFVSTIKNSTSTFLSIPRASIKDFNVLMPVPQREIDISKGSITQNPGYQ
ncbi:RagB/SusD family nutrient uptake outer membrane protein [Pedobacter sp. SD-b]|uniref:RagB/SusD family nutrient uptake outer membrane protein n=1 Tax=Pedobacter segetis TaxID=2793069 RepID=A0ABS1BLH2_9SPHI|nr:RagB/SusD family nutrient uptake outer membrane protein [Pedobacter segetis]MBK0383064.1 RagB/SusD family nutrient uptake outer membrane protein [Pedobacter segetis]